MSKKYGPITAPGQIRHRIWRVGGDNPNAKEQAGAIPSLTFFEEEVVGVTIDGKLAERHLGRTRDIPVVYNPRASVTLRHPDTDATGACLGLPATLTLAQCYAVLYSMGRQAQTDADAADA